MRRLVIRLVLAAVLVAGCAGDPEKRTLAELRNVPPDVQEVQVEQGLDKAMEGYRRFLAETPETTMTPEAMRRLADRRKTLTLCRPSLGINSTIKTSAKQPRISAACCAGAPMINRLPWGWDTAA